MVLLFGTVSVFSGLYTTIGRLEVPGLVVAILLLHSVYLGDRQFDKSRVVTSCDQADLVLVMKNGVCSVRNEKVN